MTNFNLIELIKKYKNLTKVQKRIIWMRVGLTIIASILIFGPLLMYGMNGHRKLVCPTKYVDECISMYEKHQGAVKKVLSFKNNIVTFLVEDKE